MVLIHLDFSIKKELIRQLLISRHHFGSAPAMGLKKARSPLPHDASPNSLKSKRQRHSMDRYVSMWASCVEKSVSPLPAPVVGMTEKENRIRGLPDFLESEMQGELPQAGVCGPSAETKPRPCSSPKSQPKRVPTPRKAAKKDTPPAVPKTTTEMPHPVNAYERERDERIVRNKLMMESLRVTSAASALAKVAAASASDSKKVKVSQQSAKPRKPKVVPPRRPPSTRSTRNQATCLDEDPKFQSLAFENPREFGFGSRTKQNDGLSTEHSMSCAEWCDKHKLPKGPAMDGMFTGWVSESAVAKLGLAPTKEAHWATHAGAPVKPTGKVRVGRLSQIQAHTFTAPL